MKRLISLLAAAVAVVGLAFVGGASAMVGHETDGGVTPTASGIDTSSAIVELTLDPLTIAPSTHPPQGKKIDFNSATVKSYRAKLNNQKNDFKQWLQQNAPDAKIVGSWDISLNAVAVRLNGTPLGTIAAAPMVKAAQYEVNYAPAADPTIDPDLTLINAFNGWTAGGGSSANAGTGIKVGMIDTGIDINNPCFSDAGYPAQQQSGDTRFTNNKVVVARVFNNKTPSRKYTPEAIQEHGTHTAGTVACDFGTPASVDGVVIPHPISGVAPHALLGNYNVFPGDVTDARSEDILNALDAAYADGMDIVNLSLGGNSHGIQDLLTNAIDDLDSAGMVAAVAAGNAGPGHYTVESPGSAVSALTAGAATVGHFIATPVAAPSGTYPAASGDFAKVSADFPGTLAVVTGTGANGLNEACSALPVDLTGKIALISRGTCSFSTKIRNAQAAGAVLVLVGNSVAGDPIAMGLDGTPNQPTVPAYMLSRSDAGALKADDGKTVTVQFAKQYFVSGNDDIMAGFSGQGPTDVDFRVKPDVVAPGVNVLSSIPNSFCGGAPCFAFFQGTSMATPHLAGTAAVVKWAHPTWSAEQIRSAVVNTADQGVLKRSTNAAVLEHDAQIIGAGRENVASAVNATVALDPVSTSFGAVPAGSGISKTATISLTSLNGPVAASVAVSGTTGTGVTYTASLGSGGITVTMDAAKGASLGDHQATLTVYDSSGTALAHAVLYTFIKQ